MRRLHRTHPSGAAGSNSGAVGVFRANRGFVHVLTGQDPAAVRRVARYGANLPRRRTLQETRRLYGRHQRLSVPAGIRLEVSPCEVYVAVLLKDSEWGQWVQLADERGVRIQPTTLLYPRAWHNLSGSYAGDRIACSNCGDIAGVRLARRRRKPAPRLCWACACARPLERLARAAPSPSEGDS